MSTYATEKGDHFRLGAEDLVAHVNKSSVQHGNWKRFWCENTGKKWPANCRIHMCGNEAEVGAHVWVRGRTGNKLVYILPMCKACNNDREMDYSQGGSCWSSVKATGSWVVALPSHPFMFTTRA